MPAGALVYDILARDRASKVFEKVGRSAENAGKSTHHFGLLTKLGSAAGAAGLGGLAIQSIKSAASFETTMRQISVATDAPASSIQDLSKLALKMGQDTVFSAQEAGDAMLELAKSGMTQADIKAGALAQTLTLASAGGLGLGDAAGYISSGLALFSLSADHSADVAAALAGAANASKASVQDMGLALSQVGPGAAQAGLSLQETTAALALFAKNGILGSDAGTSLKTMLQRLVPQTSRQAVAMKRLGISFTDSHGKFKSLADIAEILHDRLSGLSDAQRTQALNTIFGSDASRAASILMKEGAKGVRDLTKATSDKTQADKLAKAATSGTAGALSQLSGSIDTAKLALGTALAPLVVQVAGYMTKFANTLGTDAIPALGRFIDGMEKGTGPGGQFRDVLSELGDAAKQAWNVAKPLFGFIGDHPKLFAEVAKDAGLFAVAMKGISTVKKLPGLGSLLGGGRGGLLGGITKAAPLPVLVVNEGFGLPGGKSGPGVPVGIGGTVKEGRFSKILASNLTAQAVLLADVVLGEKAVSGLKDTVFDLKFNLSVNDAAKDFLAKLEDPSVDRVTHDIMYRHSAAVFAAVAEAAKTGDTQRLQQALNATYADLAKNAPRIHRQIARDVAASTEKTVQLISGGLLHASDLADKTSKKIGKDLGAGIGTGVRYAMARADGLDVRLSKLGAKTVKPKVDVQDASAVAKTNALVRLLTSVPSPVRTVTLHGVDGARSKVDRLRRQLAWLDGRTVNTTVGVKIRTENGLPLPTGKRAAGGPVLAGRTYLVGEREPELFVPRTSGQILNQRQMAAAGVGASAPTYNITVNEAGHTAPEYLPRVLSNAAFLLSN